MRTAEEILDEYIEGGEVFKKALLPNIIRAINEARKEAIEECAERAIVAEEFGELRFVVDKESILSLIKRLK